MFNFINLNNFISDLNSNIDPESIDFRELDKLVLASKASYKALKIILVSILGKTLIVLINEKNTAEDILDSLEESSTFKKFSILLNFIGAKVFDKLNKDSDIKSQIKELIEENFPSETLKSEFKKALISISKLGKEKGIDYMPKLIGLIINSMEGDF